MLTVLLRCKKIANHFNQPHVELTLDEALYWKAKELVWANPAELSCVTVRLGGFHLAKNFLGVIGKHMENSGLLDAWVESDVFNECSANKILTGKSWNRDVRAHKLTMEALGRILLMSFKHWQERNGKDSYERLTSLAADIFEAENDTVQPRITGKVPQQYRTVQ